MKKTELIDALGKVKPGLSGGGLAELSSQVIFDSDRVCACGGEIWVSCPFRSGVSGAVEARKLYALLGKMTEEKMQMTAKEGQLRIRQKRLKAGLALNANMEKIPMEVFNPDIQDGEWEKLPANFGEAMSFCTLSASADASMGVLTNIQVLDGEMRSCDNYRATIYRLDSPMKNNMLIPLDVAKHLANYSMDRCCQKGNIVYFTNESGVVFAYSAVGDEYPDIGSLFEAEGRPLRFPDGMRDSLMRSEIFSGEASEDSMVELDMADGKVVCRTGCESGWIIEDHDMDYAGEGVKIRINPRHLYQILDRTSEFTLSGNSALFSCGAFRHVIALMA